MPAPHYWPEEKLVTVAQLAACVAVLIMVALYVSSIPQPRHIVSSPPKIQNPWQVYQEI